MPASGAGLIEGILNAKDYYAVLGVPANELTPESARRAYIKLSRQVHPDKNVDNPRATEAFQKLSDAYTTLRSPDSRARYDVRGSSAAAGDPEVLLGEIVRQLVREFIEGEFDSILLVVDTINAQNPDLNINRDTVKRVLPEMLRVVKDGERLYNAFKSDVIAAADVVSKIRELHVADVMTRLELMTELLRIFLGMPLQLETLPRVVAKSLQLSIRHLDLVAYWIVATRSYWQYGSQLVSNGVMWGRSWVDFARQRASRGLGRAAGTARAAPSPASQAVVSS